MLKIFPVVIAGLTLSIFASVFAATPQEAPTADSQSKAEEAKAKDEKWDSEKRQAALRVQLFLDNQGFGSGKIDGRWGGFSRKAADRWNESDQDMKITIMEDGELDLAQAKDIPLSGDMITSYKVTDHDKSILGTLPEDPEAMSKLKELPYTSLMELVCEKFHADPDFVREINGLGPDATLEVGSEVKVPNVSEPFNISEPMKMAETAGKAAEKDKENKDDEKASEKDTEKAAPERELTVLREQRVVEVREAGKLIHSFPISPGANDNLSPAGNWKVSVISWMPEFRWDKSMLEDGKRSDDAFLLPPGPNNPVGIVWIGINADGIGLHGTPYPDAIGRNRSHGCIRLSNWDALLLAKSVTPGTPVIVK